MDQNQQNGPYCFANENGKFLYLIKKQITTAFKCHSFFLTIFKNYSETLINFLLNNKKNKITYELIKCFII